MSHRLTSLLVLELARLIQPTDLAVGLVLPTVLEVDGRQSGRPNIVNETFETEHGLEVAGGRSASWFHIRGMRLKSAYLRCY